jgi:hypothetical protein
MNTSIKKYLMKLIFLAAGSLILWTGARHFLSHREAGWLSSLDLLLIIFGTVVILWNFISLFTRA